MALRADRFHSVKAEFARQQASPSKGTFRGIVGQHLDEAPCRKIVSKTIPRDLDQPGAEARYGQKLRANGGMV
jgi:hypothetical protein